MAHGSAVNCLSLSPSNGRMLATGGDDRRINLWVIGKPNAIMVSKVHLSEFLSGTNSGLHIEA